MVKRALFVSLVAEALTTLAMLLSFRLAAQSWGAEGMSEWLLARRVVGLAMPAAVFGFEISLTLATARHAREAGEATDYLAAALGPVVLGAALVALLMALFPVAASTLLFGSAQYVSLLAPVAAMIAALALHVVLFAFLRGTMHFLSGNVLHLIVHGALPIAAILLLNLGPVATLLALAASIAVFVVVFGFHWLRAAARARGVLPLSRELLHNGLPRVPAAFGLLALFSVPPITVAHTDTLVNAAFLSLGMSLVTICGSAFSPLAVVLLPLAARARAASNSGALLARFAYLLPFALFVGIAIAIALFFAAELVAKTLIGHENPSLAHVFRWVGCAAAPYIFFVCARSVIDAHASSSTITRLVIVAGVVYLAVSTACLRLFGMTSLESALLGHVCSIYALAIGTYAAYRRVVPAGVNPAAR